MRIGGGELGDEKADAATTQSKHREVEVSEGLVKDNKSCFLKVEDRDVGGV